MVALIVSVMAYNKGGNFGAASDSSTNFTNMDISGAFTVASSTVTGNENVLGRATFTGASSTVSTGNLSFTASSTGIMFKGAGSLCFLLIMNATGGIATTSITCPTAGGMFP